MEVSKEILQELTWEDEFEGFESVRNEMVDTSRWSVQYEQILKHKESGKYYVTYYSRGATEMQDESPYEYEPKMINLTEVVPYEKTTIDYKKVA